MLNSETSIITKKSNTNACDDDVDDEYSGYKKMHDLLLEVLDVLLSCLIVAPCVIAYWRGTWELMGILIYPKNLALSATVSLLIGSIGHVLFTLIQTLLKNHVHPDKGRLTYYVISRCYTAVFGIICVNMWRGSWMLCDWLTSVDSLMIISVVTFISILFLIGTRTVRNLSAAPYSVTMDHKTGYFEVDTMFKVAGFRQPGLYLLDTLFSVFVIGSLVVIAWRGLWGIMDLQLYPSDFEKSSWISLIMGYIAVFTTFIIQPSLRTICEKIEGFWRLFICDIFYFIVFFGAVNAWRGIWNLVDVYIYPDDKVMSYWITHLIPFLILSALKCSNTILVRGIFIDADGEGGQCLDVPINYVRLHFQRERSKKEHMNQINQQLQQQKLKEKYGKNKEFEAQTILLEKSTKPVIKSTIDANNFV